MIIKNIEKSLLEIKVDRMDLSIDMNNYKTFFKAYIGIEDSEALNLVLFNLNTEFKNRSDVIFVENLFKLTTNSDLIEKAKLDFSLVEKSNFEQSQINLVSDIGLNTTLLKNLDKLFDILKNEISHSKLNFGTKFILWIREYLKDIKLDIQNIPKIIYYGNIKKHESYFLMYLNMCGFDVLYLNPNGISNINVISKYTNSIEIIENPTILENISLKERILDGKTIHKTTINTVATITATVKQQFQDELYNETGMAISSWQLQKLKLKSIILHTTFEEIRIYYNQGLTFRPHYESKNGILNAPVFFSKITGIHDKDEDYYDFINFLKKENNTLFLEFNGDENILKSKDFDRNDFKLVYAINDDCSINRNKTVNQNSFEISILETSMQNKILDTLEEVLQSKYFIDELSKTEKVKLLHFVLNLNRKLLLLLENFDYGKMNPKLILYINDRVSMSPEFCGILLLLHKLGFDILLLTPIGSKDIEKVLDDSIIDKHKLSKVVEDFNLSELEKLKSNSKNFINKLLEKLKI